MYGRTIFLNSMILMIFLVTGCKSNVITDQDIKVMTVEKVKEVAGEEEVIILDVRNTEKYASGHLPHAINIHLPELKRRDVRLANAKYIIVYSGGWHDRLGTAALKKLLALGYKNVSELPGGVENWKDSGFKLITEVKKPAVDAPVAPATK